MKAILKMIYSVEQAKNAIRLCKKKNLMIVNKKHGLVLDEQIAEAGLVSINLGGYGTSFSVAIGEKFGNSWGLTHFSKRKATIYSDTGSVTQWDSFNANYSEDKGKTLTDLAIFFCDKKSAAAFEKDLKWDKSVQEMTIQVEKLGGKVVSSIDKADIIVTKSDRVALNTGDDVLTISQGIFSTILPKPPGERAAPVKKFTGDSGSLWKLLSVRDYSSVQQGIELASSLPEQIDDLIDGCSVNKAGEIVKSKRFTGSGPAMAYLDVALFGLLSCAPEKSNAEKIRKSIKNINISVGTMPKLVGYDALERLTVKLSKEGSSKKIKNLSNFGTLPSLKSLKISADWGSTDLESLSGLDAPKLEELTASSIGLKDISALQAFSRLKVVDISSNADLKKIDALAGSVNSISDLSINYCDKIQSIDALQGATNLKKLNMDGCVKITSLKPLSACRNFEYLSMDDIGITSLEGLEGVVLKNIEVHYTFKPKNDVKLQDLISLKVPGDDRSFKISQFTIQKD